MNYVSKGAMSLIQREEDGYINATALCKMNGKLFNDYSRLSTTKAFISELSRSTGIPVDLLKVATLKGKNEERGTYVHPKVAIHLAQWLSPKFAVFVTEVVFDWMSGRPSKRNLINPAKAAKRLREINAEVIRLGDALTALVDEALVISDALGNNSVLHKLLD